MKINFGELGRFMQKDAAVSAAVVPFLDHAKAVVTGADSKFNARRKIPTLLANLVGSFFDFYDEQKAKFEENERVLELEMKEKEKEREKEKPVVIDADVADVKGGTDETTPK